MNDREALRKRVDDIGARIDEALERLRLQHSLYSEHGPTDEDLEKRYKLIKEEVDKEVADIGIM